MFVGYCRLASAIHKPSYTEWGCIPSKEYSPIYTVYKVVLTITRIKFTYICCKDTTACYKTI